MTDLGGNLDIVAGLLDDPDRAVRVVMSRRPVGLGLAAFLAAGTSFYLGVQVALVQPRAGLAGLILVLLWQFASGIVLTALVHLLVEMGGTRGSAVSLFVLMGLSELPWTLAVPGALLLAAAASGPAASGILVFSAIELMCLSMKARFIRLNYGISSARAWSLLALPYLASLAFLAAGAAFFSWSAAKLVMAWL